MIKHEFSRLIKANKCVFLHTSTAVVGALGTGETTLGPSVRRTIHVKESVLLFETEPRFVVLGKIHNLLRVVTEVGAVRSAIVVVALCENKDVVAATEGVLEDGSRTKVDIGVTTGGLVR